jgi:hypothetical protein
MTLRALWEHLAMADVAYARLGQKGKGKGNIKAGTNDVVFADQHFSFNIDSNFF